MDDFVTWADVKAGTLFVGSVILYYSLKIMAWVFPKAVKAIERQQEQKRKDEVKEILKHELSPIRHDIKEIKKKDDSVMLAILEEIKLMRSENEKK